MTKIVGLASLYKPLEFLANRIRNLNQCDIEGVGMVVHWVDCSPDEDAKEVERVISSQCRFPYLFEHIDTRTTLYWTWNHIISRWQSTAQYFTVVNVDEVQHPQYYRRMSDYLDSHPNIQIVACPWLLTHKKGQIWPPEVDGSHPHVDTSFTLGHFPMWRAGVHALTGLFQPELVAVGDWYFWNALRDNFGVAAMGVLDEYIGCHLLHDANLLNTARGPNGEPGGEWDHSVMRSKLSQMDKKPS